MYTVQAQKQGKTDKLESLGLKGIFFKVLTKSAKTFS